MCVSLPAVPHIHPHAHCITCILTLVCHEMLVSRRGTRVCQASAGGAQKRGPLAAYGVLPASPPVRWPRAYVVCRHCPSLQEFLEQTEILRAKVCTCTCACKIASHGHACPTCCNHACMNQANRVEPLEQELALAQTKLKVCLCHATTGLALEPDPCTHPEYPWPWDAVHVALPE